QNLAQPICSSAPCLVRGGGHEGVCIDVVPEQRNGDPANACKLLNHANVLISVIAPVTAAAATIAGLMRCVIEPGPCRFSKLRFDVEAHRFPRPPIAGPSEAHTEHSDE